MNNLDWKKNTLEGGSFNTTAAIIIENPDSSDNDQHAKAITISSFWSYHFHTDHLHFSRYPGLLVIWWYHGCRSFTHAPKLTGHQNTCFLYIAWVERQPRHSFLYSMWDRKWLTTIFGILCKTSSTQPSQPDWILTLHPSIPDQSSCA